MATYEVTGPKGEVYQIDGPDDADPSAVVAQLGGHQEPAEPADTRPVGDLGDAIMDPIRSMGSSAIAAPVAGLAGLGAMAGKAMGMTDREPGDVVRSVQSALTYQPRTKAGQMATDVVSYPFEKLAQGADYVGGKAAEVTGSPAIGAAVNTAIQAVPALLTRRGGKVGGNVSRTTAVDRGVVPREGEPVSPAPKASERKAGLEGVSQDAVPTKAELAEAAKAAYKRADDAGVIVKSSSLTGLKTRVVGMAKREGIDSDLHPDATAALNKIIKSKGDLTLTELETLRKVAKDAEGSIKPADKRLAGKIVDELDDYIDNLKDTDVVAGDATKAKALKEARALYSRKKKADTLDELVERAEISAPNFSASGMENALRTEFRALAKNPRKMRMFTAEEQAAIKKVAMGGPIENTMRFIGKFAPTGVVSGVLSGGAGAMIAGPLGVALPATGLIGRSIATRMTKKNVNAANELVRRGPQAKPVRKRNALAEPLDY